MVSLPREKFQATEDTTEQLCNPHPLGKVAHDPPNAISGVDLANQAFDHVRYRF